MAPMQTLYQSWHHVQADLFPWLEEEIGPLGERHRHLAAVPGFARVEALLPRFDGLPGRPAEDRAALARAFAAKAVLNLPTTRAPSGRLQVDRTLRRLCGWSRRRGIPSEATFSRAFAGFSECALPARLHETVVRQALGDRVIGHISRDRRRSRRARSPGPGPRSPRSRSAGAAARARARNGPGSGSAWNSSSG